MELAPEEFVGSNNNNNNNDESQSHLIVKGKRTKRRHRSPSSPSPPTLLAATSSSSSATAGGDDYLSLSSPTTSSGGGGSGGGGGDEIYESTEEEEDMANCLILLAQGDHAFKQIEKLSPTITTTTTTTTAANTSVPSVGKAGFFVYECKTCNRTFPSFQALGGHRASHKKPRAAMVEDKKASPPISTNIMDIEYEEVLVFNKVNSTSNITTAPPTSNHNSMPLQQIANAKAFIQNNKAAKIHECSICGSEFTSGQALGGHMRRHRATSNAQSLEIGANTSTNTSSTTRTSNNSSMDEMKQRNILALDLNLPAPEDDHHRESNKFQFVPTQQALVFSAPALVDCHY